MATKLYLRNTTNNLTGTFPSGEQSSLTQTNALSTAGTIRMLSLTKGTSEVSGNVVVATTSAQATFCGQWVYGPLAAATYGGAGVTMAINVGNEESSLSMQWGEDIRVEAYFWRPSTGAKVGSAYVDGSEAWTGELEPTVAISERANHATRTGTSNNVTIQAGDVFIIEIWMIYTPGTVTSKTGTLYWDGTTENTTSNASVSTQAAYFETSENFALDTGGVTGTSASTLAISTQSAAGAVSVAGSSSRTVTAATQVAAGGAAVAGASAGTLQFASQSAAGTTLGQITGTSAGTLGIVSQAASGTVSTPGPTVEYVQPPHFASPPAPGRRKFKIPLEAYTDAPAPWSHDEPKEDTQIPPTPGVVYTPIKFGEAVAAIAPPPLTMPAKPAPIVVRQPAKIAPEVEDEDDDILFIASLF